jgi:hypothetical protein
MNGCESRKLGMFGHVRHLHTILARTKVNGSPRNISEMCLAQLSPCCQPTRSCGGHISPHLQSTVPPRCLLRILSFAGGIAETK